MSGRGGAPWCDRALSIQGQLLAKKKIFCSKSGGRPQTEPNIPNAIGQQHGQRREALSEVTHRVYAMSHHKAFPLRLVVVAS